MLALVWTGALSGVPGRAGTTPATPAVGARTAQAAGAWVNITPPGVSLNFKDFGANNYGMQTIVSAPSAPRTVYLGTTYQGIYKSVDSGDHWTKVNTGTNGKNLDTGRNWTLAVDPTDANVLYTVAGYGYGQGLWKSVNGGTDWSLALPAAVGSATSNDVGNVAIDPLNHLHLLVAFHSGWNTGSEESGVIESLDGGATWLTHRAVKGTGSGHYVLFLDSSQSWLLATKDAGFWRTGNAGMTWTQVSQANAQDGGTQLYGTDNGTYYVAASHTLLRSVDLGQSWQPVGPSTSDGYYAVTGDGRNLYAQPANSGTSSTGDHPYYMSAETDGLAWSQQNDQTFTDGPMSMSVDRQNGFVYSSNWDAGVWRLATAITPTPLRAPTPAPPPGPCTSSVGPGIPAPASVPAGVPGLHAAWYGQSGYPTLCAGTAQRSTAIVAFYNAGSVGWVRDRMGEAAFLGTWRHEPGQDQPSPLGGDGQLGSPATGWPRYNRIALQPANYVGPGQVAWFQLTIEAPTIPGTYRLYLRPLIEGTTWLEDVGVYWVVTVR